MRYPIYIAARYGRREEAEELACKLEREGHTVTSRWLRSTMSGAGQHDGLPDALCAELDIEDIEGAMVLVSLTEERGAGATGRARGGRHVEFGWALARGKRTIVLGPRENVFHFLPGVEQAENAEHLLRLLAK